MLCSIIKLRRRARRSRGQAALETLLSILLMFGVCFVMWGVAIMVYDQTKTVTATQLAAQGGLVVFARQHYAGDSGGSGCQATAGTFSAAECNATDAVHTLLSDDSQGMVPDQFSKAKPQLKTATGINGSSTPEFLCATSLTPTSPVGNGNWSTANCTSAGTDYLSTGQAAAAAVYLRAGAQTNFFLMNILNSGWNDSSNNSTGTLSSHAGCGQLCANAIAEEAVNSN